MSASGLCAGGAKPGFVGYGGDLDVGVAGVGEELVMLVDREELHAGSLGVFLGESGDRGVPPFVDFRDDDELAAGLEDAEDFAHVRGQAGPPEMSLDSGDEMNMASGKGNWETEAWRTSTRPFSMHRALVRLVAATLSSEKSTP